MPRRVISILFAASIVLPSLAMANHGQGSTKVNLLYHKLFTQAVGARPADGGAGKAQPGEEWDGTAPAPDPSGMLGTGDMREFQVSADFTTAKVTAAITWSAGTAALTYDLDLFIDRQDALTGNWVQVGSGTDGQLAGDGEPAEVAEVSFPIPGNYRTRVVNFASTELAYHGVLGFTNGKKGGKPSRGRATEIDFPTSPWARRRTRSTSYRWTASTRPSTPTERSRTRFSPPRAGSRSRPAGSTSGSIPIWTAGPRSSTPPSYAG